MHISIDVPGIIDLFSTIATRLTFLLKKGTNAIKLNEKAEGAIQYLKQAFTIAPVLYHSDPERPFTVEVDAFVTGVGAISSKFGERPKLHPVAFFCPLQKKLRHPKSEINGSETHFGVTETLAGGACTPMIDQKNLDYLRTAKQLNPQQAV